MSGIPVSPWLFPEVKKPKQKKDVENIDVAWSTTKLSDVELSLAGDDDWCNKHPDWIGDCNSYVAFCAKAPTSPDKYNDANEGKCWKDCKTYIDFLKTVPSHFQGSASDWCVKTEDEREAWRKAPENNLPPNYPCQNLSDWRNFIEFVTQYNNDANNTSKLPSDFSKWFDWDILSNEYRKSIIEAYNTYTASWNNYNTSGVNKPKCKKIDDIDSYTKCLLSPASYPCQDCESWHNFSLYSDYEVYFSLWSSASNTDKIAALRSYYDFQQTANGKICTDCAPCNSYLTSKFPCSNCEDTYKYLNWTDTTYGNSTNWINYSSLSDADKRNCFYSFNKWRKTSATTCTTVVGLPTELVAASCPITGECWYDYVEFCRAFVNSDEFYNPEKWYSYKSLSDGDKRHLFIHLYDFTSSTTNTNCQTCNAMPDDIKPKDFPSTYCSDLYEYLKWDAETKGYNRGKNWFSYDTLSASDKRQLFYDYYEWQKETTAVKVTRAASSYVALDKTIHCLPDDIKSKNYPSSECRDIYEHRLRNKNKTTVASQMVTVDFDKWFEDYDSLSLDDKRSLWLDFNAWQEEDDTLVLHTECADLPQALKSSRYPCSTCGDWYHFFRWMVDNHATEKNNFYDEYYDKLSLEDKRSIYEKYRTWQKVTGQKKDPACSDCFNIPLDAMNVPATFSLLGYSEEQWKTFQLNCGDVTIFEATDKLMNTILSNLDDYEKNGIEAYTPTQGGYPTTYFQYANYFHQLVYLSKYTSKTAQNAADELYKAWISNPSKLDIAKLTDADTQFKSALAKAVAAGLPNVSVTRECNIKYPKPDVWDNYKNDGYAYETWEDMKSSGGCTTTWCEYVSWVLGKLGSTVDNVQVTLDWIHDWYKWDLNQKYPTLGTSTSNSEFEKKGTNGARTLCIAHKKSYCSNLGTYCDGITQEFRDAWGKDANGAYPNKTVNGKEMTIYEAWCQMANNSTYLTAWNNLNTYLATATVDIDTFDKSIKTEVEKYWDGNWTMPDNSTPISSDTSSQFNSTCTSTNKCYLTTTSTAVYPLAGKCYMLENTYSNMPWVWKNRFGKTTNEWYMFILFGDNASRCSNMHKLDEQITTCKNLFKTITDSDAQGLEIGTVTKGDYSDFTAPTWWGTWMIVGNGASTNGMFYHPNTGQVIGGTQYSRTNWCWKLPNKDSKTLLDCLLWFIFDYGTWVKDSNNWIQTSPEISGSNSTVPNYGNGHHGNIWASIWLQTIARISGKFYNDTENKWYHHSVLCGFAQDSTLDKQNNIGVGAPPCQLYATMANALNAMKFYDRYYGMQNNNGFGKILGFHRADSNETQNSVPQAVFAKASGAMWDESFYTNSATSDSYPCKESDDLANFIKFKVSVGDTASCYLFFSTWSNKYATWSSSTDSSTNVTTYSPGQSSRKTIIDQYNVYVQNCGVVNKSPVLTTAKCNKVTYTDGSIPDSNNADKVTT